MARSLLRLALLAALSSGVVTASQNSTYRVERVIDGDTIVISTIGTVRLIGVDTPETVDPREPVQRYGLEAAAFLRGMLVGRDVRLEYDAQKSDKYRRTLAYLYLDNGAFANLEIVRQGYGHAYVEYPFRHMEQFRAAEREARLSRRGLWADDTTAPQSALPATGPARVWVNTSSKVYHCSGTRYYGNTVGGEYLSESDATQRGFRPAYGRSCGAAGTTSANTPAATKSALTAPAPNSSATRTNEAASGVKVWVNTSSRVYHCPGTRYYGTTKQGTYMSESDAQNAGHRPAGGRQCS